MLQSSCKFGIRKLLIVNVSNHLQITRCLGRFLEGTYHWTLFQESTRIVGEFLYLHHILISFTNKISNTPWFVSIIVHKSTNVCIFHFNSGLLKCIHECRVKYFVPKMICIFVPVILHTNRKDFFWMSS